MSRVLGLISLAAGLVALLAPVIGWASVVFVLDVRNQLVGQTLGGQLFTVLFFGMGGIAIIAECVALCTAVAGLFAARADSGGYTAPAFGGVLAIVAPLTWMMPWGAILLGLGWLTTQPSIKF